MTIALALQCRNGIVLAADTEISGYPGKWRQPKLTHMFWTPEIGSLAVLSGDVDYAEMACQKMKPRILDAEPEFSAIFDVIETTIHEIYGGSIAAHPGPNKPSFSLLIAIRLADESSVHLIRTADTAVVTSFQSEFIGIGAELARYIESKYSSPERSTEDGALLAAYILYEVKQNIQGCGGLSTIFAIEPNYMRGAVCKKTEELERKFSRHFCPEDYESFHPFLESVISSDPLPT